MGEAQNVNFTVNTAALQSNYLADIQSLLDIITFVYAGQHSVTEELYQAPFGSMSFHPANNRRLGYVKAKEESARWLLTSFLTDSVNVTGNFLDECRKICAVYRLASKGKVATQEFNDVFGKDQRRFHKLGFPVKLKYLHDEFGVKTVFEQHFLTLNNARNCLVHRKGIVAPEDINESGKLVVTWRALSLCARSPKGEEETVIDGPTSIEGGWSIYIRNEDKQRAFEVGQRIELEGAELFQCVLTLFVFATNLVQSVNAYGAAQGVGKAKS